jgi:hypothetical protein
MKHLLLIIALTSSLITFSQINILDKSKQPTIKAIPYDGTFMNFSDVMLTNEKKAGIVGHKITLLKVWNIKRANGETINISDSKTIENKSFEVLQYSNDYKDILRIKDEKEEYIFEPSSIDEFVINSYIDSIKSKLENQIFVPLKFKSELNNLNGDGVTLDGRKEYKISKVNFAKLEFGYGIIVELNNESEFTYPNDSFGQPDDKGWINIGGSDILQVKSTLILKDVFIKFSNSNKLFINDIRNGIVKLGMTEKQCRIAWGIPTSIMNNIGGYDKVLRYGELGRANNLYLKGGILKLIK